MRLIPVAAVAVAALILSAIALGIAAASGGGAPVASVGGEQLIRVELSEFALTPADVRAAAGSPVVLDVRNRGGVDHDLVVEAVGRTAMLKGGGRERLALGTLAPGTYRLLCSVPGHADLGMRGTLVVAGGAAQAGGAAAPGAHRMTPEQMDASYMAGVKAFPAKTAGLGGQPLAPRVVDGVKAYELTASEFKWEVAPGDLRDAMGYNGVVPGPEIRVQLGDRLRVTLRNQLKESTAIHFHGLLLPNAMDGVPGVTQPLVKPGESFTYEFTVRNAGSHMYHSHMNGAHQIPAGLLGAFIVEGPNEPRSDVDVTMVLNDGPLGYTINGKGFPATQPIVAKRGQVVRIRYMNEGLQIHPMHLHGMPQRVIARDGYPLAQPYLADTVLVAPGERVDVLVEVTEVGLWAFHCHILTHAENEQGMFGMVTVFVAQE